MQTKFKDAFGNALVVGATYGYARNVNAIVTTFYGTLISWTDKGNAKINVKKKFGGVYASPVERKNGYKPYSSVKSNMLIPMCEVSKIPTLEQYTLLEYRLMDGVYYSRSTTGIVEEQDIRQKYDYLTRDVKQDL